MARLIDADTLKESIESMVYWSSYHPEDVMEYIDNAPTMDAVEVVRCRECKHLYNRLGYYCCRNHKGLELITEDSFCCYGERKER